MIDWVKLSPGGGGIILSDLLYLFNLVPGPPGPEVNEISQIDLSPWEINLLNLLSLTPGPEDPELLLIKVSIGGIHLFRP